MYSDHPEREPRPADEYPQDELHHAPSAEELVNHDGEPGLVESSEGQDSVEEIDVSSDPHAKPEDDEQEMEHIVDDEHNPADEE